MNPKLFYKFIRIYDYLVFLSFNIWAIFNLSCGYGGFPERIGNNYFLTWHQYQTQISYAPYLYFKIHLYVNIFLLLTGFFFGIIYLTLGGYKSPYSLDISKVIFLLRDPEGYTKYEIILLWTSRMTVLFLLLSIVFNFIECNHSQI
jgi:hypothetical protein